MKSTVISNEFATPKHTGIAVQQPPSEKTRTVERNDKHHKQGHPRAVHTPVDPSTNRKILKNKLIDSQSIDRKLLKISKMEIGSLTTTESSEAGLKSINPVSIQSTMNEA